MKKRLCSPILVRIAIAMTAASSAGGALCA
jgi:hypothetical protein